MAYKPKLRKGFDFKKILLIILTFVFRSHNPLKLGEIHHKVGLDNSTIALTDDPELTVSSTLFSPGQLLNQPGYRATSL